MKRAIEKQQHHTIKGGKHRDAGMCAKFWEQTGNDQRKGGGSVCKINYFKVRGKGGGGSVEGAEEKCNAAKDIYLRLAGAYRCTGSGCLRQRTE
jgi:hypothetical protein